MFLQKLINLLQFLQLDYSKNLYTVYNVQVILLYWSICIYIFKRMQKGGHIGLKLRSYNFIRLLGKGAWASVYEVYDQKTDSQCACKVIAKKLMVETPKLKQLVASEITVLKRVKNENVIRYIDSFSTEKEVFIFTEYCNGKDMEEYLNKKKRLSQDEARQFLKQILNGFVGLHSIGALHRDFKTANILLHNGVAKIADLGFSKILKQTSMTKTILGTSVTMAPELLDNKAYGIQCDVWSVGVVYYQFLVGDYPYNGYNDFQILKKIKAYPPRFPQNIQISDMSKDFIKRCLTIDPKKRISWTQIYEHPILDERKNNYRALHISSLMSKIDVNKNKNLYNQGIDKNIKNPQSQNSTNIENLKDSELGASERLDKIQDQIKRRTIMQKTIMNYSDLYLQRRNLIMLTIKYGISLIFELQNLAFSQSLYAFLISKRAYLQIRDFRNTLKDKKNLYGLKAYLQQFYQSKQYLEIYKQVSTDYQFIQLYAQSFMADVNSNNPDIQKQLTLDVVTNKFNTIYKQQLTAYAFQLYDHRNNSKIKKSVLLRLMTFVTDLVKGIMVSSEDYEKQIQSLDIKQMQANFAKRMQEVYKKFEQK